MPPRADRRRGRVGARRPFCHRGVDDPEIIFAHDSQVELVSLLNARSAVKSRFIVATSSAHGCASTGSDDERRGGDAGAGAGTTVEPLRRGSGTATASGGWFACRRRAGGLAASGRAACPRNRRWMACVGVGGGGVGASVVRPRGRELAPRGREVDPRAVHAEVDQQRLRFTQRAHKVVMAAGREDEILETAVVGRPRAQLSPPFPSAAQRPDRPPRYRTGSICGRFPVRPRTSISIPADRADPEPCHASSHAEILPLRKRVPYAASVSILQPF